MKKGILFIAVFLVGCATTKNPCDDGDPYPVRIDSSDPARIEFGSEYIGDAPGDFFMCGDDGRMIGTLFVSAYPKITGQSVQTKVIHPGERIPKRIYFDMSLQHAPRELDIKIR